MQGLNCLKSVLVVSMALYLVSCSSDKPKTNVRPVDADAGSGVSNEEKPKVRDLFNLKTKALEYSYNPIGKRDPFKESTGSTQVVQLERGGPLTSYDIDQMKLVAVIWGISDPRGMIQLPDSKSYIVKRNTPIGRHYGKVARVTPTAIVVEEEFRGPLGDLQIKESKLLLSSEGDKGDLVTSDETNAANPPAPGAKK